MARLPALVNTIQSKQFSVNCKKMEGEEEEDNISVDAVINALYECMSFLSGDQPDWERFKNLFAPNALFIPPVSITEGKLEQWKISTFIKQAQDSLIASGLISKGVGKLDLRFNNVV